jgi:hypothetical protein
VAGGLRIGKEQEQLLVQPGAVIELSEALHDKTNENRPAAGRRMTTSGAATESPKR